MEVICVQVQYFTLKLFLHHYYTHKLFRSYSMLKSSFIYYTRKLVTVTLNRI